VRERWTLVATILGSSLAFIDSTVVNVAIPRLGQDLHAGAAGAQWTVGAYLLPLAAFVLVGGALGDRFGHRRTFLIGVSVFAAASLACGAARSMPQLLVSRGVQGAAAALFVPASLALLGVTFHGAARGKAIGTWSALGSVSSATGPLIGGWLVDRWSWRLAFFVGVPVAVATILITLRHVTIAEGRENKHVDLAGALAAIVSLGSLTAALTLPDQSRTVFGALIATGVAALLTFIAVERRAPDPMMPLDVWQSHLFTSINALTFVVYAALSIFMFVLPIRLMVGGGFSATAAAASMLPSIAEIFVFSRWAGAWASRIGPRLPLLLGAALIASVFAILGVFSGDDYRRHFLPGLIVLGLGLSLTVSPLTTAVMAALDDERAGLASGINNAVARTAGLAGVSVVGLIAGAHTQVQLASAFPRIMVAASGLAMAGTAIAALFVRGARDGPAGTEVPPERVRRSR
jgi:EmrB/QacA subfamily drug resistance transporter